jgi:hypothetical protein
MCCLLGAVSLFKSQSHRQSIGSQLAIGSGGWITPDSPGQPRVLLGGTGVAEPAQSPEERTVAQGNVCGLTQVAVHISVLALDEYSGAAIFPLHG